MLLSVYFLVLLFLGLLPVGYHLVAGAIWLCAGRASPRLEGFGRHAHAALAAWLQIGAAMAPALPPALPLLFEQPVEQAHPPPYDSG
jgi:hypothetical protein